MKPTVYEGKPGFILEKYANDQTFPDPEYFENMKKNGVDLAIDFAIEVVSGLQIAEVYDYVFVYVKELVFIDGECSG